IKSFILDPLYWLFEEAWTEGVTLLSVTTRGGVGRSIEVRSSRGASSYRCHRYVIHVIFNNVVGTVTVLAVREGENECRQRHGNNNRRQNHRLRKWIRDVFAMWLGLAADNRW